MTKIWLLLWAYYDNSAHGVLRAYETEERATADMRLLEEADATRRFEIKEIPITR